MQRFRPILLSLTLASMLAPTAHAMGSKKKASASKVETRVPTQPTRDEVVAEACSNTLKSLSSRLPKDKAAAVCHQAKWLEGCRSVENRPILHFDRPARLAKHQKILVFALTHGDEGPSGDVARSWIERLIQIDPRNEWRVVPVLNPDGFKRKTRTNARGVDINRNYPTKNWDRLAIQRWKGKKSSDPRKYPGPQANSEPETRCSIRHIEDFKPDFIISIHTPYGLLDFDGPKIPFPEFNHLPWHRLGNYPGSLGRYMWRDRGVPVLTVELKHGNVLAQLERFDRLQDVTGTVARRAGKALKSSEKKATN
jgi:protein MpaA